MGRGQSSTSPKMKQDELTRGQNSKGPMKQGPVEKGQNGSGLSGIRPNWLRTNWEDPPAAELTKYRTGFGEVLSGKVGTGMCGPDRVPFRPLRFTNGPFFI